MTIFTVIIITMITTITKINLLQTSSREDLGLHARLLHGRNPEQRGERAYPQVDCCLLLLSLLLFLLLSLFFVFVVVVVCFVLFCFVVKNIFIFLF